MFYSVLFSGLLFALSYIFQEVKMHRVWQVSNSLKWSLYVNRCGSRIVKHLYMSWFWFILDAYFVKEILNHIGKKYIYIYCYKPLLVSFLFKSFHGWLSFKCQRCFVMALNNPLKGHGKHTVQRKLSIVDNCAVNFILRCSSVFRS